MSRNFLKQLPINVLAAALDDPSDDVRADVARGLLIFAAVLLKFGVRPGFSVAGGRVSPSEKQKVTPCTRCSVETPR